MIELKLGKSRDPVNRGTVNRGFTVIAHVKWFYEIKVFVFLKAPRKKCCQTENTLQNLSQSIEIAQIIVQNTLELEGENETNT